MMQFYAKREAFNLELQLYLDPTLQQLMPARAEVIANQDRSNRSPNGFVFPPCIVLERGESLDEFAKNVDYEFITVMQVLLYCHAFAMSCEIRALLLRLAFNRISRSMYRSAILPMAAVQLCMATELKSGSETHPPHPVDAGADSCGEQACTDAQLWLGAPRPQYAPASLVKLR